MNFLFNQWIVDFDGAIIKLLLRQYVQLVEIPVSMHLDRWPPIIVVS